MSSLEQHLIDQISVLLADHQRSSRPISRLLLGLSGGQDSTALLHSLHRCLQSESLLQAGLQLPKLAAIHVHHGLQSEADDWLTHCQQQCQQLGVELFSHHANLLNHGKADRLQNLEAQARQARWQAFMQIADSDDVVVLAHHQQDQAETFIYRSMRGAGVKGLASMQAWLEVQASELNASVPQSSCTDKPMRLWRPVLDLPQAELRDYVSRFKLSYVEDYSNFDTAFDRNYIRHQVLPTLQQRWPMAVNRLVKNTEYQQEAAVLLAELAELDLAAALGQDAAGLFLQLKHFNSALRLKNALNHWLAQQALQLGEQQLQQLAESCISTTAVNLVLDASGLALTRYQQRLYLRDINPEPLTARQWQSTDTLNWDGYYYQLKADQAICVEVKPRLGGETILLHGKHQKVKKILQAHAIPPWQRDRLPLIYANNTLLAVADICVADGCQDIRVVCSAHNKT